ncbi:MAG: hypothetical protein R3251_03030 [Candidatus Spechtbacterales bacterium]|nr:hypothetical protein [Candidatus Spechtbacterales bacterium]
MELFEIFKGQQTTLLTWDLAVVAFVFLTGLFYGMNAGRKKLVSFILSVYGSIVLLEVFPYRDWFIDRFPGLAQGVVNLVLLALFVFVLYYVFSGSFLKLALPRLRRGKGSFWQIIFLALSVSGFLTSFAFNDINLLFGREVSAFVENFFLSSTAKFIWAALPLVGIAFSHRN